jgi:uncharacterized repeat protein (TIGR01451 family)
MSTSRLRRSRILGVAVVATAALGSGSVQALTLGSVASLGAKLNACSSTPAFYANSSSVAPSYTVPAAGGAIESWSTGTTGATAGAPVGMLVLHPVGSSFEVVAFNARTLPTPLPPGGAAVFPLATPILVHSGDVLGLYGSSTATTCYYESGNETDLMSIGYAAETAPGTTLAPIGSGGKYRVNVSAALSQSEDASLSATAQPATITAGGVSIFRLTIANTGPSSAPITVTDVVPPGLGVLSAAADSGSCVPAGQTVTCTVNLGAGASSEEDIAVSAGAAGTYANAALAASAITDPNPANNGASATLTVNPAPSSPPAACKLIALAGAQLSLAKAVVPALGCTLGKLIPKASKKVAKGTVISTTPGPSASLPSGTKVNIIYSSGPPKRKKGHAKKH